ncbi:hypothetical protein BDQ12DRAFT_731560 [Crucibulum laeve]|uniref:CCHC-type domain-containing protein n=1 Tax=Crucibulum laeve TaxID=68775 RepID=A0A5C3MFY8_9AGAR|nr:hypothetical protein BDQ12DRAFT_731560 [Crucibulum laeve]
MAASTTPNIIDLTGSPLLPICTIIDDNEQPDVKSPTISTPTQEKEVKKVRRKKRKKSLATDSSQQDSVVNTRENSVEQGEIPEGSTKRKRGEDSSSKENGPASEKARSRKRSRGNVEFIREYTPVTLPSHSTPPPTETSMFFVDVEPATLPTAVLPSTPAQDEHAEPSLLLPAHVSVFGSTPVEILPSSIPGLDDDEDFIKYLDFDDHKASSIYFVLEVTRYFDEPPDEAKKMNRTVCKNCGAEGEHKTSECPVLICLTCGARNEHLTRSCPISKVCFTCGMKGHINANCPNRRKGHAFNSDRYHDCDRCGSTVHKTNECPTWWRLYEYMADEERVITISTRKSKRKLKLGEGGEGYIADDEWCYNCGNSGHWGDDCHEAPARYDFPDEPSAFSSHNVMSGPFYDPDHETRPSTSRRHEERDWAQIELGDWGKGAPENVGKQAKKKNIARLEKRAQEHERDDDADDWFDKNIRNRKSGGQNQPTNISSKKITFGKSVRDAGRLEEPSVPSLLARLGDQYHPDQREYHDRARDPYPSSRSQYESGKTRHHRNDRSNGKERDRDRDRDRDRNKDRDRDKYRRRDDKGPRYKGGYIR